MNKLQGMPYILIATMAGGSLLAFLLHDSPRPVKAQSVQISLVRDADHPARHAFHQQLDFANSGSPSFSVPAGKQLVLTYASARLTVRTGQKILLSVKTSVGGSVAEYQLLMTSQSGDIEGFSTFAASQSLAEIFADGGSDVAVSALNPYAGSFGGIVSISGYLVDSLPPQ